MGATSQGIGWTHQEGQELGQWDMHSGMKDGRICTLICVLLGLR